MTSTEELLTIIRNVKEKLDLRGFDVGNPKKEGDQPQGLAYLSALNAAQLESLLPIFQQRPNDIQQLLIKAKNKQLRSFLSQTVDRWERDASGQPYIAERCIVYFAPTIGESKTSIEQIKFFGQFFERSTFGATSGIFITTHSLTPQAKKLLHEGLGSMREYHIEIYEDARLLFNPTESEYVPQELEIMSVGEVKSLSGEGVTPHKMPKIRDDDPIAMWLGLRPGQIQIGINKSFMPGMLVDKETLPRVVYQRPADIKRK